MSANGTQGTVNVTYPRVHDPALYRAYGLEFRCAPITIPKLGLENKPDRGEAERCEAFPLHIHLGVAFPVVQFEVSVVEELLYQFVEAFVKLPLLLEPSRNVCQKRDPCGQIKWLGQAPRPLLVVVQVEEPQFGQLRAVRCRRLNHDIFEVLEVVHRLCEGCQV